MVDETVDEKVETMVDETVEKMVETMVEEMVEKWYDSHNLPSSVASA